MNPFDSRETQREYNRLASEMTASDRKEFAESIQSLFWEKQMSEEGEFDCFKVTVDDVRILASEKCFV